METPTIYLAGAIRDGHPEDIEWRERYINTLENDAIMLNPLGQKTHSLIDKKWYMSGVLGNAKHIVKQDFWCIDRADIVIANLLAMSSGYPSIGTMMELGRATSTDCLIYAIVDPGFNGHKNPGIFKVHPFLDQCVAQAFPSENACLEFVSQHLQMLSGDNARFGGDHKEREIYI